MILRTLLLGGLLGLSAGNVFAQSSDEDIERQRLGQTGMKFLSYSVDARSAALADAATALEGSAVSLFYNPAGMAHVDGTVSVALNRVSWLADIGVNVGSVAFRPGNGQYGVFGVSVESVDYGEVPSTVRADNAQGYESVGTITPSGLAAGLGYARSLTDRFAVGGQIKYVTQSLGESVVSRTDAGGLGPTDDHEESTVAFDFGVLYRTGFRSLNFGVSVRNFSREVTYAQDSFELPLTMRIGFSMDVMDLASQGQGTHSLLVSLDAERPRDYKEQLKAGLEYGFADVLSLRAGYLFPTDEQGVNLGFGLHYPVGGVTAAIDYAYTQFGDFGSVNRVGLSLGF